MKNKALRSADEVVCLFVFAAFFILNASTVVMYFLGCKSNFIYLGIIALSFAPYYFYLRTIRGRDATENTSSFSDSVQNEGDTTGHLERVIAKLITSERQFERLKMLGNAFSMLLFFGGVGASIFKNTFIFFWWGCILAWLVSYPVIRGYVYRATHKSIEMR